MPKCTKCLSELESGDNFCSDCGHPVATDTGGPQSIAVSSAEDTDDPVIEALEIGAEVVDIDKFGALCIGSPDEALLNISKLEKQTPELGETYPVPLFKFLATARKVFLTFTSKGTEPNKELLSLCEQCMHLYLRAEDAARAEGAEAAMEDLEPHLEPVAMLLETYSAGKVQELLGETKLKYYKFADRISITKAVQSALTEEDICEILGLPLKTSFTIRSVLFGVMVNVGSSKRLCISLYEKPEVWGSSDQMNPIAGNVWMTKENKPGSHWALVP